MRESGPRTVADRAAAARTSVGGRCLLAIEIDIGKAAARGLQAGEALHVIERCIKRASLVVESNGGLIDSIIGPRLLCSFRSCDAGAQAAREMIERIEMLPAAGSLSIAVRIGLHHAVLADPANPFKGSEGDCTVRLLRASDSGQALASLAAVTLFSRATRHFVGVAGTARDDVPDLGVQAFAVAFRRGSDPLPQNEAGDLVVPGTRLKVIHEGAVYLMDERRPVLLVGRELGNDIVILDPRASRQHARIERVPGGFRLIDSSTNGTFVALNQAAEKCLQRNGIELNGNGRIGCGFSADEIESDLVYFELC